MRVAILLSVILTSILGCHTSSRTLVNEVVVRTLDMNLPADQEEVQDVLMEAFANKPEEMKFDSLTISGWRSRYHDYEDKLLAKAKIASLDCASLRSCLVAVYEHAGNFETYLPVGAYCARQAGTPVWIVVVKWQVDVPPEVLSGRKVPTLSHIRAFVFDSKTHKLITWMSCG